VEEAKAKEELAPGLGLVAAVEEVEIGDGVVHVGADEVGAKALWRFVRHLDAVLEDGHWEGVGRVAGEPETERLVRVLRQDHLEFKAQLSTVAIIF